MLYSNTKHVVIHKYTVFTQGLLVYRFSQSTFQSLSLSIFDRENHLYECRSIFLITDIDKYFC